MEKGFAPSALRMPNSRVRSLTVISMIFDTPTMPLSRVKIPITQMAVRNKPAMFCVCMYCVKRFHIHIAPSSSGSKHSISFFGKAAAVLKNETVHFVAGLILVIFSVYLLLAFSSFFFTGAADQSIIDSGNAQELISTHNGVKNYAGSRGAQLASYLINDCFGISSFFILVFLAVAGLKLMRVRVVRLWKWFIGCSLLLIWFSIFFGFVFVDQYKDSFLYLGGMHGYNVSNWECRGCG